MIKSNTPNKIGAANRAPRLQFHGFGFFIHFIAGSAALTGSVADLARWPHCTMPAIIDILINRSPETVWATIADPLTHIHWLGRDGTTTYDGELVEGMRFTRAEKAAGLTLEGEIIAVSPERFLKVRVDPASDRFVTTEYHLIAVSEGCALRVLCEVYDTGETQHIYLPEVMEEEWKANLERLRSYCERA